MFHLIRIFGQSYVSIIITHAFRLLLVGSICHNWGLAPFPNDECGSPKQTADHVSGARDLPVWNDETRCWLNTITASQGSRSFFCQGGQNLKKGHLFC